MAIGVHHSGPMNGVYHTAMAGMVAAQSQMVGAARAIANPGIDGTDTLRAMVDMKQAEASHSAAATVARTASDMEDRLLDILA